MAVLSKALDDVLHAHGVTRRTMIAGSAGLAALAFSTAPRIQARQASPAATTRTVETIHGPVEIPANPQRIVTLTYVSSIAAAELGVLPVGITRWVPDLPPDFPDLASIAKIENEAFELDLEAITSLKPDLIIGSDFPDPADQGAPYEELSRIAPTVLFEWTSGGANWEVEATGCADALGKTDAFEALRTACEERSAGIASRFADILSVLTVDFIDAGETEWYLHGPASTHCKVAIDAGISLGAGAGQEETFAPYSFEQLNVLVDTGAIVVRGGEFSSLEMLNAQPTFTTLPAVKAGLVLVSNYFYVASYAQSFALLDEIEGGLVALGGA